MLCEHNLINVCLVLRWR